MLGWIVDESNLEYAERDNIFNVDFTKVACASGEHSSEGSVTTCVFADSVTVTDDEEEEDEEYIDDDEEDSTDEEEEEEEAEEEDTTEEEEDSTDEEEEDTTEEDDGYESLTHA